ncbi:AtuA-related protein [Methylobacterium cerastii]|uniref:AtuA-related protein n=1 Tax=Methylobacterium cerastii TaxID=932741 RepID=UPI00402BBB8F
MVRTVVRALVEARARADKRAAEAALQAVNETLETRYALPRIGALNFVMTGALGGGATRSLALDAHGKGLGSALLDLEIPD